MKSFKVCPETKDCWFEVCIFRTKPQMYKYRDSLGPEYLPDKKKDYDGVCCSTSFGKNDTGCLGKLLLTERIACRYLTVAHELAHVACQYFAGKIQKHLWYFSHNRKRVYDNNIQGERFANISGNLADQYWTHYFEFFPEKE